VKSLAKEVVGRWSTDVDQAVT